ncbi:PREDICTED: uncharacterized protein LOC105558559 [Vollenhovia emeryi]|uniref:uncharacterized protein LOC105558559 n=1 Tax=Vollenhovia emeryi TaxID=411798 RepID=UPI0005F51043|nr:PREDICTED: uncharacterized protein LOC105558559 [Vollenhovia emeryi]
MCLKKCGKCELIYYCGPKHQKQHWRQHESFCKAVCDTKQSYYVEQLDAISMETREKKMIFIGLVATKLGLHSLEQYEREMLLFPRECAVCLDVDEQSLRDCRNCAASYCKDHINSIQHNDVCVPLSLGFRYCISRGEPIDFNLQFRQQVSNMGTFQNMKDFINTYINLQTHSKLSRDIVEVIHSEYLSHSLTLFHAMRLLDSVQKNEKVVVHVVGANNKEQTIASGPELIKSQVIRMAHKSGQKECLLTFHKEFYEEYVRSSSFVKPDLIVGFDVNISIFQLKSPNETWAPSIRVVPEQNCPFVLTAYTRSHLEDEIKRINSILDRQVDYLSCKKNPFACLTPHRWNWPDNVCYENQYMVLYKSLSP